MIGSVVEQQQRPKRLTWTAAGLDCLQGIGSGRRAFDHTLLRHHSLQQLRSQPVSESKQEWHETSFCSMHQYFGGLNHATAFSGHCKLADRQAAGAAMRMMFKHS